MKATLTQMNTRIDKSLKRRGDAALAQAGFTPSSAVRGLWQLADTYADTPSVVEKVLSGNLAAAAAASLASGASKTRAQKLEALEAGWQIAPRDAGSLDIADEDLRERALNDRLEERGLL